jgi:hypothetical protein
MWWETDGLSIPCITVALRICPLPVSILDISGWGLLQFRTFFCHDRTFDGTDLEANAAINAGGKINPIPVSAFGIFSWPFVDAGYGTGIYTICNAFTNFRHDRMCHCVFSVKSSEQPTTITRS